MELKIRLFATLKDAAGQSYLMVELNEGGSVAELRQKIAAGWPDLAMHAQAAVVAVNRTFAEPDDVIQNGDEVAMFPPVSGGSQSLIVADAPADAFPTYFALTADTMDLNGIHAHLIRPDVGAIATFAGSVRGQTTREGLPPETLNLEYEAYEEMAVEKMAQIAREIWEQWPQVKGIAIVQRIGLLQVGEMTTYVACASGHRDEGIFAAARYGIDRLKEIVPVWKREIGRDQSVWVEGDYRPTGADN